MKEPRDGFDAVTLGRANNCIAQGALTNSKRPEVFVKGIYPTHLTEGTGCIVWDTHGKSYVDFICGLGSNLLGYANEGVINAAVHCMRTGSTLSLSSLEEIALADKLKANFLFTDKWKFFKTGSEACQSAIRIARAKFQENRTDGVVPLFKSRDLVLSEGYHGHSCQFVSLTPPAVGIPQMPHIKKLENFSEVPRAAAVIVEPFMTDVSEKRIAWLRQLREICNNSGTVLIFDEIITGFRVPKMSVSNYTGIHPDLICLGKALANGEPLSAVGGKNAIMGNMDYFTSGTFNGSRPPLAAAVEVIDQLKTKRPIAELWALGEKFLKAFNSMWTEKIWIEGYATRGVFRGDDMVKALFWQECCRAGILFGPSWFINFEHSSVIDRVLNTCSDVITKIKTGQVHLEGEMPQSPFAQKMRG